ncbi:MAG: MBL fold metallo-hydrolase, partial [Candidatus Hecatellaceae archaeon]
MDVKFGLIALAAAILLGVIFSLWPSGVEHSRQPGQTQPLNLEALSHVRLTIVYDNNPYAEGLKTGWGFSCLVEADGEFILFDTGGSPKILAYNLQALNVDVRRIKTVVLSHIHGDHTGGLPAILSENSEVTVYLPASFPESFKREIQAYGCRVVEVSGPMRVCRGVGVTGELGLTLKEQALIVNTKKGLIVITGCAHPGVVNMASAASKLTGEKIYLVIGGFHLAGSSKAEISKVIGGLKELGVACVAPCHCTGSLATQMFREEFG